MISIVLIPIALIIFLYQSRFTQFCIVTISILFPITFGDLRSIPDLLVVEWLVPVFFLITLNDLIPLNSIKRDRKLVNFRGTEIFIFAILILLIWTIVSFINNEIIKNNTYFGSESGGLARAYFKIIIDILSFFSVVFFMQKHSNKFDVEKWLRIIIYFSIFAGVIRIITYFTGFDIHILGGVFEYDPEAITSYRVVALSDTCAAIGIPAIIAQFYLKKKLNLIATGILIIFMFLGAGRNIMISLSLGLIIYSIFFYKKNLIYIILIGIVSVSMLLFLVPENFVAGQFKRLTKFEGGIKQQDILRYVIYKRSLENFDKSPVFGKGISNYEEFIMNPGPNPIGVEFIRQQLTAGGHGAYIGILGTFGLGGITHILIMVFGGIILSFKKLRKYILVNPFFSSISIFAFICLIEKSLYYITANTGTDDISLFLLIGLLVSIRTLENSTNSVYDLQL